MERREKSGGGSTFMDGKLLFVTAPIISSSPGQLNVMITLLCFFMMSYTMMMMSMNRSFITSTTMP